MGGDHDAATGVFRPTAGLSPISTAFRHVYATLCANGAANADVPKSSNQLPIWKRLFVVKTMMTSH